MFMKNNNLKFPFMFGKWDFVIIQTNGMNAKAKKIEKSK